MDDWRIVTDAEPWQVGDMDAATVGEPDPHFQPTREFQAAFPRLAALLGSARRSAVALPAGRHTLFAWDDPGAGVRAWLCPDSPAIVPARASPDHQVLLGCFGGITARFNEPARNWLLNHNHALTVPEVDRNASFMTAYAWAFEECSGIPIDVNEYYPAAWEANGNCVLCDRRTGALLFFAPDHADPNLVPYGRCPMYTLHTHRGAASLRQWVESVAGQWATPQA